MHTEAMEAVAKLVKKVSWRSDMRGLDIGGQYINGTARGHVPITTWDVLDIDAGRDVTIIADACTWRTDQLYDVVLCTEVLEHVEDWRAILATCAAALTPGGVLLLTCASTGRPPHGAHGAPQPPEGEWYGNVDPDDLKEALDGLFAESEVSYRYPPGDAYALAVRWP